MAPRSHISSKALRYVALQSMCNSKALRGVTIAQYKSSLKALTFKTTQLLDQINILLAGPVPA